MQEYYYENTPKRNGLVLTLVVIGAIVLLGTALVSFVGALLFHYQPIEPDASYNLNLAPFFIIYGGYCLILAVVAMILGISTYKGKKGSTIALIIVGILSGGIGGYICAVAAIIALIQTQKEKKQAESLKSDDSF